MDMLRSALRALSQSMSRLIHIQKRGIPSARVKHFNWGKEEERKGKERGEGEKGIGEGKREG